MRKSKSEVEKPRAKRPKKRPTKKQAKRPAPSPEAVEAFQVLGLSERSATSAGYAGFEKPTKIQEKAIPVTVRGSDVIACSETGSGKTASFALPILDRLDYDLLCIQAVVLVPTRELCQQVATAFMDLSYGHPLRVVEIIGGASYVTQRKNIAQNPQVLVGTPGRVLDLLQSKSLDFSRVNILVLDEADRMLDMGFLPQMRDILRFVPKKRQTMMFSATIPTKLSRFVKSCLKDPVNILVGERSKPPSQVNQEAIKVLPSEKAGKLLEIVAEEPGTMLIFSATKRGADEIFRTLKQADYSACVIHSDLNQNARKRSISGFGEGRFRIMVATDIAQRGLDIEGISLVINYDLPNNAEDYVHRIGRTGRAEAAGRAVSLVTYQDFGTLRSIERVTGHKFKGLQPASKSLGRRAPLKRKLC